MGKRTTEKFSKGTKSLFLEQGESTNEYICPGLSEALDIAPRASVYVGDWIYASFEHEGFGYFGDAGGIVYQVNLTTMRLVNQNKLGELGLITGFASGVYGWYGYFGGNGFIIKFDLKTLAVVKTVGVSNIYTGFAYNAGYFGDNIGTIT